MTPEEIDARVAEMDRRRAGKDYAEADRIRAELLAFRSGRWRLVLSTGTGGTEWHWTTRAVNERSQPDTG